MPELVALDLPGGPGFVDALRSVWDAGDAALPLDPRLPGPAASGCSTSSGPRRWSTARVGTDDPAAGPPSPGTPWSWPPAAPPAGPRGWSSTTPRWRPRPGHLGPPRGRPRARTGGWPASRWPTWAGSSVVTRALVTGTPCTVLPEFDAADVERLAGRGRHAGLAGGHRPRAGPTSSGYRAVLLGGAAPPDSLPGNVVTTYGMTETGSGIVYDGRPSTGWSCASATGPPGRDGEVLVRGPMLLRCYRDGTDPKVPAGGCPPATRAGSGRTARCRCSGGWPRSSSPAGRRSGRPRSSSCWPAIPASTRWRSGSGPTPSGASGWWPGWSRSIGPTRPGLGRAAGPGGRRAGAAGPRPGSW